MNLTILKTTERATITLEPDPEIKSIPIWHSSRAAILAATASEDGMSCELVPVQTAADQLAEPCPVNISVRCMVTGLGVRGVREISKNFSFEVVIPETDIIRETIAVTTRA